MHTKHIGSIITAALLCLLAPFCMAQEARELTSSCVITSPNKKTDSVHDGEYTSFWRSRTGENPYLEFQTPEGEAAQYLYICFAEMPEMWSVETETDGEWRTLLNGSRDYMHVLLELDGQTHFRIVGDSGKESYLINQRGFCLRRRRFAGLGAALGTHPGKSRLAFAGCAPGR